MRKSGRWLLALFLAFGLLGYLHIGKQALDRISISKQYIRCSIQNSQWMEGEEKEISLPVVFWREIKSQTIKNQELFHSASCPVMKIYGNSSLLFPGEFPLDKEDKEGCLIGKTTAWQLFGDTNVIGKSLIYDNRAYIIRGVLSKKDVFVCQSFKNGETLLNNLTYYASDYREREQIKQRLSNEYSLNLEEYPDYWYGIFIRAGLLILPVCIMITILIWSRKNKFLFRGMALIGIIFLIGAVIFAFDITPDKLPNRISDFDFWVETFQKGIKDLFFLISP